MPTLNFVLLVLALVCFGAAAFNVKSEKVNLTALGLALWVLSSLVR